MTSVVICEKPSQAANIKAAVGSRYGEVLAAQGHLVKLADPELVNPDAWGRPWRPGLLWTPGTWYPYVEDKAEGNGKGPRLTAVKKALKAATTVYVACDCDREGTLIGAELVQEFARPGTKVVRVIFNNEDKATLQEAFANPRPWAPHYALEAAAGMARQQADAVYGLSLTRTISVLFPEERPDPKAKAPKGKTSRAKGIGRVRSPTWAIVARRELEIAAFRPTPYFEVVSRCEVEGGPFLLRHAPTERITDPARAQAVAQAIGIWTGGLKVETKAAAEAPPRLMDLGELQKACSARFGWSADDTLAVAQRLYERHIITYPRAETRYLAEAQVADVGPLVAALTALPAFARVLLGEPVIRTGKKGYFSDAGLNGASHSAVIPNIKQVENFSELVPQMDPEEAKLWDLVSRRYLAAMMPDHLYSQTNVLVRVGVAGGPPADFRASGRVTTSPGWRQVYDTAGDEEDQDEDADDGKVRLPPLRDGEPAFIDGIEVLAKKTVAPRRYTEGTLIDAMQNAWRFAPVEHQEKLKAVKGIGTPATRSAVLKTLKAQGLIALKGKQLFVPPEALQLFRTLEAEIPRVFAPVATAIWETKLDLVAQGTLTKEAVVAEIAGEAGRIIATLLEHHAVPERVANSNLPADGRPSDKALALAVKLSAEKGIPLPEDARTDWKKCRAFVDGAMKAEGPDRPPSPNQLALAQRLASEKGQQLPADVATSGKACSAFIEGVLGKRKKSAPKRKAG